MPVGSSFDFALAANASRRALLAASVSAAFSLGGAARAARRIRNGDSPLLYPLACSLDADGAIYVVDLLLPGVWKVVEGKASPFYRAEKKFRAPLAHPRAVAAVAPDQVVVADSAARDLFLVKAGEAPRPLVGGKLDVPAALVVLDDAILVADTQRNEVWRGGVGATWSKRASVPAPRGLAVDAEKQVWVVSARDNGLYRIAASGGEPEKIAQGEPGAYWSAIAVGADGVAVVVDSYAKTLWRIESGKPVAWVKDPLFDHPVGILRQGDDFLVADSRAKSLFLVSAAGKAAPLPLSAE